MRNQAFKSENGKPLRRYARWGASARRKTHVNTCKTLDVCFSPLLISRPISPPISSTPLYSHVEQHGIPGVYPELPFVEHESVTLGRHEPLHLAHQTGSGASRLHRQRLRHAGLGVPALGGLIGPCHDSALCWGVIGGVYGLRGGSYNEAGRCVTPEHFDMAPSKSKIS